MTAALLNTAIALPDHAYSQAEIGQFVGLWLTGQPETAARAQAILANAEVERRFTVRPAPWYLAHTSVTERSAVYREEMVRLCEQAARQALSEAGVEAGQVGLIITTSCTGLMIPSVEAHLLNRMPFRADTRRMPLTALGCVGGAAAVSLADEWLAGRPASAALIISAELASLTAQLSDFSMANIVSAALFGDGAAATVVAGPGFAGGNAGRCGTAGRRPARVMARRSVHFSDSIDMMGFDNTDGGLKIFLSPRVPRFIREALPEHLEAFLADQGLCLADLRHFLLHPGGRKVIEGLERQFGLTAEDTRFSRAILRAYGNLSSATVLFMLHHFEREATPQAGDRGLLLAVGPGFCAEMVLLQW